MDIERITDPFCGNDPFPGSYSTWHLQPQIKIPASSSLSEGDKILISYYHTPVIAGQQVCASLTEPASIEIAKNQLLWIRDILDQKGLFKGWFLNYDEIRVNSWDNKWS